MKVCIVTTAFPRWVGDGQAAFVWEAARSVANQGIAAIHHGVLIDREGYRPVHGEEAR